jgi:aspartyl protease family protein
VRRLLFWLLLAGAAVASVLVFARHGSVAADAVWDSRFAGYGIDIVLVVLGGAALAVMFRHSFGQALAAALTWIAIGLVLLVGYTYRFELHGAADRVMAELVPGHVITHGRSVELARAAGGNFDVVAQINGARVAMILDTGASSVVLTREDARIAGLPLEVLSYSESIETANGRTRAAPITLDRIAVGGLVERSVQALVAQPGQLRTSLLGMSFLNRLQSWEVRGDRLLLRGYP